MLSNGYFLTRFLFDTAENEPAENLQNLQKQFAILQYDPTAQSRLFSSWRRSRGRSRPRARPRPLPTTSPRRGARIRAQLLAKDEPIRGAAPRWRVLRMLRISRKYRQHSANSGKTSGNTLSKFRKNSTTFLPVVRSKKKSTIFSTFSVQFRQMW